MTVPKPHVESIPHLVKITLQYIFDEDRVRIAAVDNTGAPVTLWLTARLLHRFVPHLIERSNAADALIADEKLTAADQAEPASAHDSSVQYAPGGTEILVASIELRSHGDLHGLTFKGSETLQCAALSLKPDALMLLIGALKKCFSQAGWSQKIFEPNMQGSKGIKGAITIH